MVLVWSVANLWSAGLDGLVQHGGGPGQAGLRRHQVEVRLPRQVVVRVRAVARAQRQRVQRSHYQHPHWGEGIYTETSTAKRRNIDKIVQLHFNPAHRI